MISVWAVPLSIALLAAPAPANLLTSAQLRREEQVLRSSAIRDGQLAAEGDFWDTSLTAIIRPQGVMEFDLGKVTHLGAALLQGDNNDEYIVWGSRDGQAFEVVWRSGTDPNAGMRTRTTRSLNAEARYVRLTAQGGDAMYSVGELQLFSDAAQLTDGSFVRASHASSNSTTWLILVAFAVGSFLFFRLRRIKPGDGPPP
ncbi:MAG: hypothetical protein ACYC8T_08335 [Myxococcaceae bacterium]